MQQKLFNLLGATAFLMSGAILVGSAVVYTRIPSITQHYMGELQTELTKVVTDMIPGQIDDVMPELPELPSVTGPALPF